jgi:hypothetical protein
MFLAQQQPEPDEEPVSAIRDNLDELESVRTWRLEQFAENGFDPKTSVRLARRLDIDWHKAVRMLDDGCSHEQVLEILL